jgi:hypothetical protein
LKTFNTGERSIQMFFYTIMNIFVPLLEKVNKSQTSAGSLSLTKIIYILNYISK